MGVPTTASGERPPDAEDRPLWPPPDPDLEGDLLARDSWGGLFDRWYWTTRCFLGPIASYDEEQDAQLFAHKIMVTSAFVALNGHPAPRTYEETLCESITKTLATYLPARVRATLAREPGAAFRRWAEAFVKLSESEQLMVSLYDYDTLQGGRTSRHAQGRFRAEDIQRLLRLESPNTVRQRASRARARLRSDV
jgi:hypothetical protein